MQRIVIVCVFASALIGAGYSVYPSEYAQFFNAAVNALLRVWENIEANPYPFAIALGTFLATVAYHKARGKTLRECVEVAATRVTVVPVPQKQTEDTENPVIK